jgi:DNA-binding transcriptional ArsR family regulator
MRAGGSTQAAPARPIVRDFTGAAWHPPVTFDPRTVFDFVISLHVAAGEEADLAAEDARWLKEARGSLPEPIRGDLDRCFGDDSLGAFHALPSIALANPGITDAAAFVSAIHDVGADGLRRVLLEDIVRHAGDEALTERVLEGDEAALAEVQVRFDEWNKGPIMAFLRDPQPQIDRMRVVVDAWLPRFQEVEARVRTLVERDVASRRHDRQALSPRELIERTTGGLRWLPDSQVRRVVMAPSYFARPYNYIYQGADWRLFAYPVSDQVVGALDAAVPPQAVVRLYRALGDGTRMRILKLLADRDWYLTELAQQLELSKPTMKHHLALLRAAGLVTVTEEGSLTYYSLRRERLDEAGAELRRFLG